MNFQVAEYDLNTMGRNAHVSISCKVKGYWSRDTITIYIQRGTFGQAGWSASISYGSGGRDTKEVASDMEAGRYFAEALTYMCILADSIISLHVDTLEKAYQACVEEYRQAEKLARQAKEAAINADKALGEERAKVIVNEMIAQKFGIANVFARSEDRPVKLEAKTYGSTTFYIAGSRVSKANAIERLASSSERSSVVV
jgi:hypothetical protein